MPDDFFCLRRKFPLVVQAGVLAKGVGDVYFKIS